MSDGQMFAYEGNNADSWAVKLSASQRAILLAMISITLVFGFFAIDHSPGASTHFRFDAEFIDSENRTADRVETVNLITAPVRLVLGIAGLCLFFLPPKGELRWGGMILCALLLYAGYLGLGTLWSNNPKVTIHKFAVLVCFGIAAAGLARQLSIGEITAVFVGTCVIYIVIGVLAEIVLGNFTPHKADYRFVGTCHPNTLAVYGTFCCMAATVYFGRSTKFAPWLIALFVFGFITLLATKSRTTLAGFIVALMAVRFVTFKPNYRVFASAVAMLILIAGGLFLTLSRDNVRSGLLDSAAMGRTEDVSSLTGRLPLWEELMRSIGDRPLVGHGYLAFWEKEKIDYLSALLKWEIPHGHNMYLDVLLDGGFIGLSLFLLIFLTSLLITFRRCILNQDWQVAIVFGLLVFALVHGFAESLFKLPTFLSFMLVTLLLRTAFTDAAIRPSQYEGHVQDLAHDGGSV